VPPGPQKRTPPEGGRSCMSSAGRAEGVTPEEPLMRPEIINRAGEAVAQGDRRLPVKPRLRQGDVLPAGGEEVVDAQRLVSPREQPLAQVRPDEPGAPVTSTRIIAPLPARGRRCPTCTGRGAGPLRSQRLCDSFRIF
jgi:hypothetical protein